MAQSHIRQAPWTRILIESVAIVASILLALWIDARWDAGREQAEQREILDDLRAELSQNIEMARRVAALHEQFGQRMGSLNALSEADAMGIPRDSVSFYLVTAYAWPTFDPSTFILDGLGASGRIAVLFDPEVRRLLGRWRLRLDDLREEADLVTRAADRFLSRFAETGPLPSSDDVLSNDRLRTLVRSDEQMGIARTKVYFGNTYARELARAADAAEEVLSALERPN